MATWSGVRCAHSFVLKPGIVWHFWAVSRCFHARLIQRAAWPRSPNQTLSNTSSTALWTCAVCAVRTVCLTTWPSTTCDWLTQTAAWSQPKEVSPNPPAAQRSRSSCFPYHTAAQPMLYLPCLFGSHCGTAALLQGPADVHAMSTSCCIAFDGPHAQEYASLMLGAILVFPLQF
jgi:hypothetical protein